jgi:hypothetical protein
MKTSRRSFIKGALASASALMLFAGRAISIAFAQQRYKINTPIPASIPIPDHLETRLGTLHFFAGFPDKATIGIEPGKPFNPPTKLKVAMEKGVVDAYYYMQKLDTKLFASNLYWPDRHWSFVMVPDQKHGFEFVTDDAV